MAGDDIRSSGKPLCMNACVCAVAGLCPAVGIRYHIKTNVNVSYSYVFEDARVVLKVFNFCSVL